MFSEVEEVEESQNRPAQVDDGFESLNGNGSSDNNEEEDSGGVQVESVDPREGVLHGSHIHTIYTSPTTSSDPYPFSGTFI